MVNTLQPSSPNSTNSIRSDTTLDHLNSLEFSLDSPSKISMADLESETAFEEIKSLNSPIDLSDESISKSDDNSLSNPMDELIINSTYRAESKIEESFILMDGEMPKSINDDLNQQEFSVPFKLKKTDEIKLNLDIITLFECIIPTEDSINRRNQLVVKIQSIFDDEFPNEETKVYLFGSSVNTLGTITSDADICVLTNCIKLSDVRNLATILKKHGFSNLNCISEAKVPIVKAWDPILKLACDINVNNPLAIDNTLLLKTYASLDPRVRPFAITVKYWTKQRLLNDAAAGGTLSTYSWVNLILNFLQTRKPPILPVLHAIKCPPVFKCGVNVAFFDNAELLQGFGNANKETLGGLLYSFFRRFACEFNYEKDVISLRSGRILDKEDKGWIDCRGNNFFCIEEPFNTYRNLANSADSVSVKGLQGEFRRACHILADTSSLSLMCEPYFADEDLFDMESFDSSFLDLYDDDIDSISEHISRFTSKRNGSASLPKPRNYSEVVSFGCTDKKRSSLSTSKSIENKQTNISSQIGYGKNSTNKEGSRKGRRSSQSEFSHTKPPKSDASSNRGRSRSGRSDHRTDENPRRRERAGKNNDSRSGNQGKGRGSGNSRSKSNNEVKAKSGVSLLRNPQTLPTIKGEVN